MNEKLERLFSDNFTEEYIKKPRKIKKLKKLEIISSSSEEDFNPDKELYKIIEEGSFKDYIPFDIKIESQKTAVYKEDVLFRYIDDSEKYDIEIEYLLDIHLQFPSQDEMKLYKNKAWTNFKILLEVLKENKGSHRLYNGLKFYRIIILSKIGLKKYILKLPLIVSKMKNIIVKKIKDDIEYIILMDIFLSTFEKRILAFGDYINCAYKDFEKQQFSFALEIYNSIETTFSHNYFEKNTSPYELLFFPLSEVIEKILFSNPKYPKYIYVKDIDLSYYYLSSVRENEKYWKIDPWMDKLSLSLEIIFNQCFVLYEKIYFDKYQERVFHSQENKEGISEDLSTLFKNLKIMSNRKRCSTYLRKHLFKSMKYTPKKNDFFDKRTEDSSIFHIYETITQEDINQDWENTCKKLFFNYNSFCT
jgi:hypothetical protein